MVDNKNIILPEISNHWTNLGTAHILRHNSFAVQLFGNRKRNRLIHYDDRVAIRYNNWCENLAQQKVTTDTEMMTHKDLPRGKSVEQFIPLTSFGVVADLVPMQIIKRAMGSSEATQEFIADKVEQAADRGMWEIDKKVLKDLVNDDNYAAVSIIKNKDFVFKSGLDDDGMENVRKIIDSIVATCSQLTWPSKKFNKLGIWSNCLSLKRIGLFISFEFFGMLESYYGTTFNLKHTELGEKFAWVKPVPIFDKERKDEGFDKHVIATDVDGYIVDLDEDAETGFDDTRKTFRERWFYKWIDGYVEPANGYNRLCWKIEE
ncbi:MAG: hypothetical protein I3273_04230 [Candidatus Moeniiplasma glomeromycotorum]|nr:hypothetical protein [Candidatus Moeniiplasma glomeromycotorum]